MKATYEINGLPCLIVAIGVKAQTVGEVSEQRPFTLIVLDDGRLSEAALDEVKVDWRYDFDRGRWLDVGVVDEDQGGLAFPQVQETEGDENIPGSSA